MERRTRIWVSLGAAVLVGGTAAGHAALSAPAVVGPELVPAGAFGTAPPAPASGRVTLAQADEVFEGGEGGEGEGGEGGGQVLGTITEFRLSSTDPAAFAYDASPQVAAY